jgi:hypothetical protein
MHEITSFPGDSTFHPNHGNLLCKEGETAYIFHTSNKGSHPFVVDNVFARSKLHTALEKLTATAKATETDGTDLNVNELPQKVDVVCKALIPVAKEFL